MYFLSLHSPSVLTQCCDDHGSFDEHVAREILINCCWLLLAIFVFFLCICDIYVAFKKINNLHKLFLSV